MNKFEVGDQVEVLDPGLLRIMELMPNMPPNNLGIIRGRFDNGDYLIEFPIGEDSMEEHSQIAPYPRRVLRRKDWMDRSIDE